MAYTTELVSQVTGFIGWLPYEVLAWGLSKNKLLAKEFFRRSELLSPRSYAADDVVEDDYVVKSTGGSFGYQVNGPYKRGTHWGVVPTSKKSDSAEVFAEQFIPGKNLKVWFWGSTAVYAQMHAYPIVVGDGESTVQELVDRLQSEAGGTALSLNDQAALKAALSFQGINATDFLAAGQQVWLDFRYGRRYAPIALSTETDSNLGEIDPGVRRQIDIAGAKLAEEALILFTVPILFSVDGVVDFKGKVWWLEVNSNPMVPPEAYPLIFVSMFGSAELVKL